MPRAKAAPKTEETPKVQTCDCDSVIMPQVNGLIAQVEGLKTFETRLDALEAAVNSLVRDVSILKKLPGSLATHEAVMDRHTERLDSLAECLNDLPKPKPKKWLGIL